MKEIFLTLREIYNKEKETSTIDFAKGFAYAIQLFIIGMEKHPQINLHIRMWKLESIVDKQRQENVELKIQNDNLNLQLSGTVKNNNKLKALNISLSDKNKNLENHVNNRR